MSTTPAYHNHADLILIKYVFGNSIRSTIYQVVHLNTIGGKRKEPHLCIATARASPPNAFYFMDSKSLVESMFDDTQYSGWKVSSKSDEWRALEKKFNIKLPEPI